VTLTGTPAKIAASMAGSPSAFPGILMKRLALPPTWHFHWAKSGEYVAQVTAIGPLGLEYMDARTIRETRLTWTPPAEWKRAKAWEAEPTGQRGGVNDDHCIL